MLETLKKIKDLMWRRKQKKVVVLMYHRINHPMIDPWNLCVSPWNFEQQLQVLSTSFDVISISELVSQIDGKRIKKDSICITFDDGYFDNYANAKPLLEKYNLPATFFIPDFFINHLYGYWWDELSNILFSSASLPVQFELAVNKQVFKFNITGEQWSERSIEMTKKWRVPDEPPSKRAELYLQLSEIIKGLPRQEINSVLHQLKKFTQTNPNNNSSDATMTEEQIRHLISNPLFDVGLHTHSHPALSHLSFEKQKLEIEQNRIYFENNLNRKINILAYPHGNYNEDTLMVASDLRLSAGFTTEPKCLDGDSERFTLGRFQVTNCDGDMFTKNLRSWLDT